MDGKPVAQLGRREHSTPLWLHLVAFLCHCMSVRYVNSQCDCALQPNPLKFNDTGQVYDH